jgi:hypothetical protein
MELDRQTDNTKADSDHQIVTFHVAESEFYRFIRLRQTGVAAEGREYLIVYGFELFGYLVS